MGNSMKRTPIKRRERPDRGGADGHPCSCPRQSGPDSCRLNLVNLKESYYSPFRNIGDIWGLEEGADESSIILDTDEVGFDALLQDFV